MIEIEKGVPLKADRRTLRVYPFREMEVGDSFAVPVGEEGHDKVRHRLSCAASVEKLRTGRKYSTRVVTEDGVEKVRVWRVA